MTKKLYSKKIKKIIKAIVMVTYSVSLVYCNNINLRG